MTAAPRALALLVVPLALACARGTPDAGEDEAVMVDDTMITEVAPHDQFWAALTELCGRAYEGRVVEGTAASDSAFASQRMVMHVRDCSEDVIRIPFHVGQNRSRTWVLTRMGTGLRLKHDHRHEDGSEDDVTQYGGDTAEPGTAQRQDFHADEHTASLIPAAATNIWSIELVPGQTFTYGLRREAENRRFRVEFDLSQPVTAPPPPWGS